MLEPSDSNFESKSIECSPWNPFSPTERDIQRTQELAKKNIALAGSLCFFAPVFCMLYLNRGINNLKIIGYACLVGATIGATSVNIENSENRTKYFDEMIGITNIFSSISLIAENIRSVTLARKRLASQKQSQE
jgi:hypothetical protein